MVQIISVVSGFKDAFILSSQRDPEQLRLYEMRMSGKKDEM